MEDIQQDQQINTEIDYEPFKEEDEIINGEKIITKNFLKKLIESDMRQYYGTPRLNTVLYLHFKGFNKITNLEKFTGLNCIYLEGNAISKIQGLDFCQNLKQLCLHQNCISKIENLQKLKNLIILNLQENFIQSIEGLEENTNLETLQIQQNKIGVNGLKDLEGLLKIPSLKVLDIQQNCIKDTNLIDNILSKMPNLSVLYQHQNDFLKSVKNYRKSTIIKLKKLKFLDEKPITDEERIFCEAFSNGGIELERKVRKETQVEKEQKRIQELEYYRPHLERLHQRYQKMREQNKLNKQRQQQQEIQQNHNEHQESNNSLINEDIPQLEEVIQNIDLGDSSVTSVSGNYSIYNSTQQSFTQNKNIENIQQNIENDYNINDNALDELD